MSNMNLSFRQIFNIRNIILLSFFFILVVSIARSVPSFGVASQGGEKVPHFVLKDLQGHSYSLKQMIGKGVIHLTFFATWCEPCRKDYPKLNDNYVRLKSRGYILLGIGVPTRQSPEKLKRFAMKENIRFPILFDASGEVVQAYNASLPKHVIIDRNGVIAYHWDFLPSNHAEMIEKLLLHEK